MDVLDWRKKSCWIKDIDDYAGHLLTSGLLESLRSRNIQGCWSDDMSWLPDLNVVDLFKSVFCDRYTYIKCFHGCRPISVSEYYKHGFVGQNREVIENQFKEIFKDVSDEFLDKAIGEQRQRGGREKGKVYFACDDKELIDGCGQYLIHGSEYLMALAAKLNRYGEDYRLRLREVGTPTLFEVDVPVTAIPDIQITDLSKLMVASWANVNLFPEKDDDCRLAVIVHRDIDSSCIVNHSHPEYIVDNCFGSGRYYPLVGNCDMCGGI